MISAGSIILFVAKLSDDFLLAGNLSDIDVFMKDLQSIFVKGKIVDGPVYSFGGCDILIYEDGSITMKIKAWWKRVKTISISRTR